MMRLCHRDRRAEQAVSAAATEALRAALLHAHAAQAAFPCADGLGVVKLAEECPHAAIYVVSRGAYLGDRASGGVR